MLKIINNESASMEKIKKFITENKDCSVVIIRIGLALVLLWFGVNQVFDSDSFLGYMPAWAMPHPAHMMHFPPVHVMHSPIINVNAIIIFNGISEIVIGMFLLAGLYTRIFAFIAAMHLFIIAFSLGYNDIAVRDFGLALMAVSLIFSGAGSLSFDSKKDKK